jgi:predicted AAA+ superfamily ATPase
VLLWGEKGAGKSTMVRSLASKYSPKGLRIIEFCDNDFYTIYDLYAMIRQYGGFKFIIYFDDVSFDDNDEKYRNFKSIVEGGLEEKPANALFMATSNRRHLISETIRDTSDIYSRDDQNESASLYARFGLSIGFYPLTRELYLEIAAHYLQGSTFSGWEEEAMAFAIERGGRSGRVAEQFAIYKELTWKH